MKTILETIDKAANGFMFGHVTLNEDAIKVFHIDTKEGTSYFSPPSYLASLLETVEKETAYKIIHIFNAINASLQYSFFTARADIRFDGIDSQWIITMLDEVFEALQVRTVTDVYRIKEQIIERLIDSNITLLRSRVETVEEVFGKLNFYEYGATYADVALSIEMIKTLVCFKQDLFFKKGLFAVMMTGRMLPELKTVYPQYVAQLSHLPVPADYQIPKMLRHYGLIVFSEALEKMVEHNIILQENSEMELNIRAATVLVCGLIAKQNGVSADDVDGYLFSKRDESGLRHHLCVTEGY
jgi:hypothetical protein